MEYRRDLIAALLVLLATRLLALPRSVWEFDEALFVEAVRRFEPLHHHPPPPGYPVYIALGKLLNIFFRDSFASLVALSLVGTLIGFVALAVAFGRLAGNERIGLIGSFLFYFSAVLLVHSTLAISDPPALGLLSLSLLSATQLLGYGARAPNGRDAVLFGIFCALTVGCRPQFSIAILPMLLWVLAIVPSRRMRLVSVVSFAIGCTAWLVPLVVATGGPQGWSQWMGAQATYFALHDAAISRGGRSWAQIGLRFIAHPWGPKWLSIPLLVAAAVGLTHALRLRRSGTVALALLCSPYLLFSVLLMDPADGPRYALPSLPLVAFLAACGAELAARRSALAAYGLASAFAISSAVYVSSFIAERGRSESPPVQAARYAYRTIPQNSVILSELPLWPHAQLLFKHYRTIRIEEGLRGFSHRPEVPLYLYADGDRRGQTGATFRWAETDAYGKLTRNHYRVVSLIPVPPAERYRPLQGVYPSERTVSGEEWRWLDSQAEIELPSLGARQAAITLGLPRNYPFDSNSVALAVNGRHVQTVGLRRGESSEALLELPQGPVRIRFRGQKSFVPAELPGTLHRDPRRLSVKLLRVRQL